MTIAIETTALSTPRGGEPLEFADYVAGRRPALLRAARAIAGDPNSAEDLLQRALARVFSPWSAIHEHPGTVKSNTSRGLASLRRSILDKEPRIELNP